MSANGAAPQTMGVNARAPQQVFVGGYLLPHGSFRIDMSPIDPTTADVIIIGDHEKIPKPIRDQLDKLKPQSAPEPGQKPPPAPAVLADLRVFATLNATTGPIFIEVTPRGINVVRT